MKDDSAANGMAAVVQRNIQALLERRRCDNERKPRAVLVADAMTRFAGSMRFIYPLGFIQRLDHNEPSPRAPAAL